MTAEIFGRETGLSKGKAATCISSIPTPTSRAADHRRGLSASGRRRTGREEAQHRQRRRRVPRRGRDRSGAFLESLNLASVQNLPVVFVIEDNDWAISMPKERVTDVENGTQRAGGFDLPGARVDVDDAVAIYEAAGRLSVAPATETGPTLLEVQVHRRTGHFMGDAEGTVPDEDKAAAEQRDSIERLASELRAHDVSDETIDDLRSSASERVEEAIEWAKRPARTRAGRGLRGRVREPAVGRDRERTARRGDRR